MRRPILIVAGHLHYASSGAPCGQRYAIIDSAGFPFDGDHRVGYATVSWDGREWHVANHRLNYNYHTVVDDLRGCGAPYGESSAQRILQGQIQADIVESESRQYTLEMVERTFLSAHVPESETSKSRVRAHQNSPPSPPLEKGRCHLLDHFCLHSDRRTSPSGPLSCEERGSQTKRCVNTRRADRNVYPTFTRASSTARGSRKAPTPPGRWSGHSCLLTYLNPEPRNPVSEHTNTRRRLTHWQNRRRYLLDHFCLNSDRRTIRRADRNVYPTFTPASSTARQAIVRRRS